MATNNNLTVFLGLYEIAGYSSSLKKGFDELGVSSFFAELNDHPYNYGSGRSVNAYFRMLRYFGNKIASNSTSSLLIKILWQVCQDILKIPLFLWALAKYNTFIFVFGISFYYLFDLPLLKLCRKKIIFIFLGSDSRPPYINGKYFGYPAAVVCSISAEKKNALRKIGRYADFIIDNPASSHFHERDIINGLLIGFPSVDALRVDAEIIQNAELRIVHAPSSPKLKGTDIIRSAIKNLQCKGYRIRLFDVIDRPNAEVHDELSRCDFVIDELYSDAIMSGFALEAARYAKPAIVGGYTREHDWGDIPSELIPPVHHCQPDEIEAAIEQLIIDKDYRIELGKRACEFVRRNWTPLSVVNRILQLLNNDVPEYWMYNPKCVDYLQGWGLSDFQAREFVGKVIKHGGSAALHLQDKPELEAKFIEFAGLS